LQTANGNATAKQKSFAPDAERAATTVRAYMSHCLWKAAGLVASSVNEL